MAILAAYATVILVWSTTSLGIVLSNQSLTFISAITGRMVIGTAVVWLVMLVKRKPLPLHNPALASYAAGALSICGGKLLTYWAANYFSSGVMAVMWGTMPMAMALVAKWVINERLPNRLQFVMMLAAVAGLALIFVEQAETNIAPAPFLAWLAVAIAVFCFAFSAAGVKRLSAGISPLQQTTGTLALSTLILLIVWMILDGEIPTTVSNISLAAVVYLGVIGSAIGFFAYYYVLRELAAGQVALIPVITPIFALILGVIVNNESVGIYSLAGSLLVIASLGIFQWQNVVRDRAV